MNPISTKLHEKFFSDPDWSLVQNAIMGYVEPLIDMSTVDTTQPAEHVKAEIIGRRLAYDALTKFLGDAQFVSRKDLPDNKNPFK